MAIEPHHIAVVDDDPAIIDSLTLLLEAAGHSVTAFTSGDQFLSNGLSQMEGCVLLDVRMPGKDGIAVLQEALSKNPNLHVVMMSGHGDIPMAVKALKLGAQDFIEKPFQASAIMAMMEKACENFDGQSRDAKFERQSRELVALLTPREKSVAQKLAEGKPNKIVSFELGISIRTVETHRARIMSKLRIRSVADLVRILIAAGESG